MRATAIVLIPVLVVLSLIAIGAYADHTNGLLVWDALAISVTAGAVAVAGMLGAFVAYVDHTERAA